MNVFARKAIAFNNEMRRSCGALLGITQGLLADGQLHDKEVEFLRDWLTNNEVASGCWPGDVICSQVKEVLADGIITAAEREHLAYTLQMLVGGTLTELAESTHVSQLPIDPVDVIDFGDKQFCLTGEFVFGPRSICAAAIERRGGTITNGITKKLNYVVIGGLGSPEWKHGSFGTKIEKAMQYKREGVPMLIVHEDVWATSLSSTGA